MRQNLVFDSCHKLALIVFVMFQCQLAVRGVEFPPPITKCHFSDEKCLIEQGHKILQKAATGIPEVNIPILEPLKVKKISILGSQQSAANIDLLLTDVEFHNYTKPRITSIKGFSKDTSKPMQIILQTANPRLTIKSKYKISGNILILPIKGQGQLTMALDNVKSRFTVELKPEKRDGKTYLNLESIHIQSKIDNAVTDMTNLFNGDKTLSENMLKLMNDNWRLLSEDMAPHFNEALEQQLGQWLKQLFQDIPFEDYFLTD